MTDLLNVQENQLQAMVYDNGESRECDYTQKNGNVYSMQGQLVG
jgi:hypothetical protein